MTVFGLRQHAGTESDQKRHPCAGGRLQIGDPVAHPVLVQDDLGDGDGPGRVSPLGGLGLPGERVEQPIGRPRHGGDRGNAEAFVDLGTFGVVDPRDNPPHTEGFPGQPGRNDVGVVAG